MPYKFLCKKYGGDYYDATPAREKPCIFRVIYQKVDEEVVRIADRDLGSQY